MSLYEFRPQEFSLRMGDPFTMPPHLHSHMEIVYLTEGELHMSINRERRIMHAGDLAIVFPNIVHAFKAPSTEGGLEILIFSPSLLRQNRQLIQQYHPVDPFVTRDRLHPDIPYVMHDLLDEVDHPDDKLCPILFDLLMVRLMPLLTMQINAQNSPFDMTNRAAQYLMQHFDDPTLTLDTAAAALGISRFALSRLFTGQLELSFSQYLRYLRVDRAKELLASPKLSILQIGLECGFNTPRSFERAFREQCGCSPRAFRQGAEKG